eukprot:CAMPEP_0202868412 /NCGR_PEP_ID=MMETSP1391-20130828/10866_1 /ASSEMBLY_ACC=CAM_ASM_000867 /TAXON_ID=1034604 /ORGANISM="Chlamydomonas leiostraca, Strain SAG 11-49" /LENGTH=307 /DNA_ID=CAMNT_0049548585 /DNA_START=147 /DNA_END=1070 /DNA_ORIENTATION=-
MDTQAKQFYNNHPAMRAMLADLKHSYDNRQANSQAPRSLEAHFQKHDQGNGEVRIEDFKAGWALGGVKLGPMALSSMRGAYGDEQAEGGSDKDARKKVTIRYGEVLNDLDALGHGQATNMAMTSRMGAQTARFVGYTEAGVGMGGYLALNIPPPKYDPSLSLTKSSAALTATSSNNSLLRSTHCRPVTATGPTSAHMGTFNTTEVISSAVTQRRTATHARSAAKAADRILGALAAAGGTATMADALRSYDPAGTGCVTVDAFLTAAARAGVTVQPEELDVLRAEGTVRRPYAQAPELLEYANLPGLA